MNDIRNISIPEPCHQSWNEMTPQGQGRHCQQCSKVVTDFTAMTNSQIIDYFSTYGNVCGRFGAGQLNSLNNQLELEEAINKTRWKKWTIAASLFLATAFVKADAQSSATPQKQEQGVKHAALEDGHTVGKVVVPRKADKVVKGTVCGSDDGLPIVGATIKVRGNNIGTMSDANGKFTLTVTDDVTCIDVSVIGYQPKSINIDPQKEQIYSVKLAMSPMILGEPAIVTKRPGFIKRAYYKCIKKPVHKLFSSK